MLCGGPRGSGSVASGFLGWSCDAPLSLRETVRSRRPHEILTDMDRTAGGALRWARALLLAVVAMGSGVIAHLTADGRLPGPAMLGLLFLLCVAGAAALLGRPASTLRAAPRAAPAGAPFPSRAPRAPPPPPPAPRPRGGWW